ncbi:tyrosine-protein phosphatase [Streptomyces sp. CB03238]|uniref:tyrosine-protein phosphatase n=1 Tax=Streptomyces sp. CB03238 TaxID=1907777 RepID=UPI000A11B780|nr:tyrosine-protein phosphatase [Streptomyces sp. CB03238]ORT56761.1 protein tyrosine phosphatase [Streptomyces sp. CB03238]
MTRHLNFERLHNFRDLGGYVTGDGRRVRWGKLFRSDSLGKLSASDGGEDWDRFLALGVRTVIDLRYPWEIDATGRVPGHPSLAYHNLSVEHRPYNQAGLGPDVEPGPYLVQRYLEVAHDGVKELRRALEVIAAAEDAPVVFHCASGKDRTGLLAALVLALLGVDETDIVEDFTLTELATERLVADWRAAHSGRLPDWPGYGRAPADVMRLFLAALAERHGSVCGYATGLLGVDDDLVAALRENLLEAAGEPPLSFRRAGENDLPDLVRLRDDAARWQLAHGIDQWKPGQLGEGHFRARLADGEVWIATLGPGGPVAGAWELWWEDPAAWGPQPPTAGYVHRLMTDRRTAPPGTGRRMLAEAERRVAAAGRSLCRLDCLAGNARLRAYYEAAGYGVVGEQAAKDGGLGRTYAVTLLEKRLPGRAAPVPPPNR